MSDRMTAPTAADLTDACSHGSWSILQDQIGQRVHACRICGALKFGDGDWILPERIRSGEWHPLPLPSPDRDAALVRAAWKEADRVLSDFAARMSRGDGAIVASMACDKVRALAADDSAVRAVVESVRS